MTAPLRVIVTGLIGHHPLGGMTWHYVQYVVGLQRLGYDVYYVEDTGKWPYDPGRGCEVEDCSVAVNHVATVMSRFDADDRWAYRSSSTGSWYGLADRARDAVLASADLLLDVSGSLGDPSAYRRIPRLAYIDTDPVFTQIGIAGGRPGLRERVDAHDVRFSFGERIAESKLSTGHHWRPTRQPILLDEWHPSAPRRDAFTTVMNWKARSRPAMHDGRSYGQKDEELARFIDLPQLVAPIVLELAANAGRGRQAPHDLLRSHGWQLVDPESVCLDFDSYRRYIESSAGEWSVAKNGYVRGQPGWFSERSACYLAAGRPVVAQDTGFSTLLPVGEGLLPFTTLDEAVAAIREVSGAHRRHAAAARAIAEEYFDSGKVLARLVEDAFASEPAARAWRTLRGDAVEPERVVTIRERPKAAIFRLDGVGRRGAPVVAKRCDARTALIERQVYERILPRAPVSALHYYGHAVEDDSSCWLFLELAGGSCFAPEDEADRMLAARWLAGLHGSAAHIADARQLPDRGPAHYLDHLRSARLTIAGCMAGGSALADDRALLERVIEQCDVVEAHWREVDAWCAEMPQTLVHGDFRPKNVHVRNERGRKRLLVMDWETAGWGVPAADIASIRGPRGELSALEAYVRIARRWWPNMNVELALLMVNVGKLFRRLAAIRWCSVILPHRREKSIAVMTVHRAELAAIIEAARWT